MLFFLLSHSLVNVGVFCVYGFVFVYGGFVLWGFFTAFRWCLFSCLLLVVFSMLC